MQRIFALAAFVAMTGCGSYQVSDIGERGGYCSNVRLLGVENQDEYLAALQDQGYINSIDVETFRESVAAGPNSRMIATGMTDCGVRMVWGAPDDIDVYGGTYGRSETWMYIDNGYYSDDYHFINFGQNGTVTSWAFD